MPIGDLLAEISGGQPLSAPSPKSTSLSGVKRKAEDASNGTSTKATRARQPDGSYSTSKVTRDGEGRVIERSYSGSRPAKPVGSAQPNSISSSTLPHRTPSSTNGHEPSTSTSLRFVATSNGRLPAASSSATQSKRPSEAFARSRPAQHNPVVSKGPSSRPFTSNPASAPKKGSFKEIMARGAKAQEVMGKVGMIQHRSTDKGVVKKDREVPKPPQKSATVPAPTPAAAPAAAGASRGKMAASYTGTGRSSATTGRDNGPVAASARPTHRNGPTKDVPPASSSSSKPSPVVNDAAEKKAKKSATATTGYAGTARPRPGATPNKGPASRSSHRPSQGGLLAPPRMNRRNKYEDDYDEDLDDFIDYDEEDDDPGPRYYDSDGSSDMEAGLSDIDSEERRAEQFAREEDKREQILEEKLKREKEERKKRWARSGR